MAVLKTQGSVSCLAEPHRRGSVAGSRGSVLLPFLPLCLSAEALGLPVRNESLVEAIFSLPSHTALSLCAGEEYVSLHVLSVQF